MSTRYIHFTDAQKEQARQTDLVSLLKSQGEKLKRSGSEYEWRDGSQKVTVRGNLWFHQYERTGGDAVDFVRRYYGKTYPEAVEYLLSGSNRTLVTSPPVVREAKPFDLPPKNNRMSRVYAYLIRRRKIDKDVLDAFVRKEMIYESADYHNAVFVGFDTDGVPRHAHKRGTGSQSSYKGNIGGSLPEYSFHWHGVSENLYLFEAPIDMLSFISMHKENWRDHSYAAACGVSDQVMWQMMKDNPHIEKVYLCLDNDVPGQEAAERLSQKLMTHGVSHEILIPTRKDWNEDRQTACASAPHKSAEFSISEESEENSCPTLRL